MESKGERAGEKGLWRPPSSRAYPQCEAAIRCPLHIFLLKCSLRSWENWPLFCLRLCLLLPSNRRLASLPLGQPVRVSSTTSNCWILPKRCELERFLEPPEFGGNPVLPANFPWVSWVFACHIHIGTFSPGSEINCLPSLSQGVSWSCVANEPVSLQLGYKSLWPSTVPEDTV